tara:strand:- start:70 stop:225 length:156 start_codon:yes stop_codon:yes gene_type:complete
MNAPENATLIERLIFYSQNNYNAKARALAQVADFLEECYVWDVKFDNPYIH